jgi:iron-sulfur cluster repair protein YtfE (RIC family)
VTDTLGAALELEHREIDRALEAFLVDGECGDWAGPLRRALEALRRHIYLEEEFLFPPMHEAGFVAPIAVMLREHGDLWRTMDAIERHLAAKEHEAVLAGECKWLLAQLDKHNAKEEPILYPHADRVLGAPASSELVAFLEIGRMPPGWVCGRVNGS